MKLARKEAPGNNLRPNHSYGPFATAAKCYLLVDDIIKKGYDRGSEKLQKKLGIGPKGAYVFTVTAFIGAETVAISVAYGFEKGIAELLFNGLCIPPAFLVEKEEFEPVREARGGAVDEKNGIIKHFRLPILIEAVTIFAVYNIAGILAGSLLLGYSALFYAISGSSGILERAWKTVKEKIAALNAKSAWDSVSKFENNLPAG